MSSGSGHRILRLATEQVIPWRDGDDVLPWIPVRSLLGLRAFGASAFRAAAAGDVLVHEHDEAGGRGHQELYVVVAGSAAFTVDGQTSEAPSGTLVLVEPTARRSAVALEPGTSVLVLGREPDFVPAGHEYLLRVRAAASDPVAASAIAAAATAELPESPGAWYAAALAHAYGGRAGEAEAWLTRAVGAVPELAEEARRADPLLAALLGAPGPGRA